MPETKLAFGDKELIVKTTPNKKDEILDSFFRKLSILIVLSIGFIIAVVIIPYPVKLLPQLLLGMMFAHSIELEHELTHHIIFFNERVNRLVGTLLGLPMLVSFSLYKALHGHHHSVLGTPEDKETFNYNYEKLTSISGFILHLSMLGHYSGVVENICATLVGKLREDVSPKIAHRIRNEYCLIVCLIIIMLVLSILWQTTILLDTWLIPLIIFTGPIHALIELPEHFGCDNQTTNPFHNTRTIQASKFLIWYVNGNNYHIEHHFNPALPINELRNYHSTIVGKIENLESSYWSFYKKFFDKLFSKKSLSLENN
ncbi:fatty acid desaturase family protein [Scytonema sp. PRP1]|uniref:fatty acid desaturase family protein n=1 Tax=Scytonema sp. PRP1 TaxID=3120513 RepID=UPI002FCEA4A3